MDAHAAASTPDDLGRKTARELAALLREFRSIRLDHWTPAALSDTAAMVCYGALRSLLLRGSGIGPGDLLKGLPGLASAVPVERLWDLSRVVRQDPGLLQLVLEAPPEALLARVEAGEFAAFRASLRHYLDTWGFRYSGELTLTQPTPREDPLPVLRLLRSYAALEGEGPADISRRQALARQRATRSARGRLRGLRRAAFGPVLAAAQASIRLRERARMKQALLYTRLRLVALALGDHLVARGWLGRRDDVLFLELNEAIALAEGRIAVDADVKERIAARRRELEACQGWSPPDSFVLPAGEAWRASAGSAVTDAGTPDAPLTGTGACGGRVCGTAAVVLDVSGIDRILPDQILVTRQTDPGWAAVFFMIRGRPGSTAGRPYESYLAAGQRRIAGTRTRVLLDRLGLQEPRLGAELLHRYFAQYRRLGVLPAQPMRSPPSIRVERVLEGPWRRTARDAPDFDPGLLPQARLERIDSDDAILSEIASARVADSVALWRLDLAPREGAAAASARQLVLKVKSGECELEELTVTLAGLCRPALGQLFQRFQGDLGLAGSTERELELYALNEPRLQRHLPRCYGLQRRVNDDRWALLLECLPETRDPASRQRLRDPAVVAPALLEAFGAIHAIGFGRGPAPAATPGTGTPRSPERMLEMLPLWHELADFASPWFARWGGPNLPRLHLEIIKGLDTWWQRLQALPAALVHNDFNPRNAVLRDRGGWQRLCVYDWELATRGIPQHDLAEWLCFSSPMALAPGHLDALLVGHREALIRATGQDIDAREWHEGFVLALRHLLIERLAMYTLIHRFRPLDYLPSVLRNWLRQYAWATDRPRF
ncbi:phosphoenolpyruvate synthetase (PEP synthase) [Thioalkalivibrio nitratireducens DSM 14787]|uniref:Phosphoenolpyruvate synthetase (PEP synthase) n=1 Tax=Thioalkalivibrio nitratireducens (strain DSM 14787 / UNIQEM 213 / ALEN2) TaxID=1255043 RepID=L0E2I4_THIND|nr:phosphotransferase [Thioalkalivibrio nitratireducens]AGA35405.1 phosphoenolpyruvate synthetase (PEP synthase) [Thioalkalivibrio nitratireducens DSM 14787]